MRKMPPRPLLTLAVGLLVTNAFPIVPQHRCRHSMRFAYGRGAEIWPPGSEEQIRLTDSFPNQRIPPAALAVLQRIGSEPTQKPREWRKILPRAIARILRRAASSAQKEETSMDTPSMDKTPLVVALTLLFSGYVRPLDVLLVIFLSGYFCVLSAAARQVRADGITPVLPALPPQGHVPTLVRNPLGPSLTYSSTYDRWLKLGVMIGLLAPILAAIGYTVRGTRPQAKVVLRPMFFLCCQAMSEAVGRQCMTPLPLRILVPIAYNTVRLGYLWHWTMTALSLEWWGRLLAIGNLVYWSLNLFGFLLPVAAMRYLRAHCFAVEAEQVTTRSGMEESVGLLW